ncbi:hypothetical protein ACFLT5_02950 [Chloroflexota bacterium]
MPLVVSESPLLYWLLASLLLYALGTNILWWVRRRAGGLGRSRSWLVHLAKFLYYLGIPYLALGGWPRPPVTGLLSPGDMGLVTSNLSWPVTRWLDSAGTGFGLGFVSLLLLLLAWVQVGRSTGFWLRFPRRPWFVPLVDVVYLEVHWSFYRGALFVLLGDFYTAVFVALGLIYLEWATSPFWRRGWQRETQVGVRWLRAALALLMALIFILTRNLWVCLAVHGLVELIFWRLASQPDTIVAG